VSEARRALGEAAIGLSSYLCGAFVLGPLMDAHDIDGRWALLCCVPMVVAVTWVAVRQHLRLKRGKVRRAAMARAKEK
jgi:hypothetical protein